MGWNMSSLPNISMNILLHTFQIYMKNYSILSTYKSILNYHTHKIVLVLGTWIQIILKAREYFSQNSNADIKERSL